MWIKAPPAGPRPTLWSQPSRPSPCPLPLRFAGGEEACTEAAEIEPETSLMSQGPWSHHSRNASVADDIDFEIKGQELQFVEIELDPGESAVAEAGSFVWKDASIEMTTMFGDGSGGQGGGF